MIIIRLCGLCCHNSTTLGTNVMTDECDEFGVVGLFNPLTDNRMIIPFIFGQMDSLFFLFYLRIFNIEFFCNIT